MSLLERINTPNDLKKLNFNELNILAIEIRKFLVESISKTGGHLASNLGVVELTIAIHYCFNSPIDKIIWDVGHQSYVHKILTGRKKYFNILRKYDGLSGFPKASESEHDIFDTGHSSTSISAALGFSLSRDLAKEDYNVIGVIGDGSLTGGLAFEGLNNAGRSNSNMIIIINDNEMSISENVGGLTKHLNDIRSAPSYIGIKRDVRKLLDKLPKVGEKIGNLMEMTKDKLKYLLVSGVLFEELGFKYIGPIDGHNIEELIRVFGQLKNMKGPIILHVYTRKGMGYSFARKNPEFFHGISAFDIKTGKVLKTNTEKSYSNVFGEKLLEIAEKNNKVIAITAAMPAGTGLSKFEEKFPDRTFDVGIAEGHAVTFAAGVAKNSFIPIVCIYSTFLQRAYDNILHDVCIQNLHVVFAIDRSGIVGDDGETHQGIFDISYLSHIPNMAIVSPKNKFELESVLEFAINQYKAPIAIRYPRGIASDVLENHNDEIVFAKSETIFEGEKIAIISVGDMMNVCYNVVKNLRKENHNPTLINARFIKPIDTEMLLSLKKYEHVFIVEENIKTGGYYSLVLPYVYENKITTNIHSFSLGNDFIKQCKREQIFRVLGLDEKSITEKIISILK